MEKILELRKNHLNSTLDLEKKTAFKIIRSKNPLKALREFPKFERYQKLTDIEWHLFQTCLLHKSHNFLFIGGGPLPISAILYALKHNLKVKVLDLNKEAIKISRKVVKALKLEENISIELSSAEEFDNYDKYEVIIVAAMAGSNEKEKEKIFTQIRNSIKKGTHILARTSESRVYPKITKKIYRNLIPLLKVSPGKGITNSLIILKN